MKPAMKTALIIIVSILAFIGQGYLLLNFFVDQVHSSRSCGMFNIDHVELHIKADIPNVGDTECDYDPDENVRLVKFDFDVHPNAVENYASKYDLSLVESPSDFQINNYLNPSSKLGEHIEQEKVFFKQGKSEHSEWSMVYDKALSVLWVRIEYV